jgi:rhamnose utilization protein RhaD (predicted bifunctional aldolase and dehydrogenase)
MNANCMGDKAMTFEQEALQAIQKSVLKVLSSGNWIGPDHGSRIKIPPEYIQEAWEKVDHERIKCQLAERIEKDLADRIVNHLAAEMATDIKSILSVKERREALRAIAREHIEKICKLGPSQ